MKFTKFFVFFTLALLLFAGLTAAAKHDDHKSKDDHKSRDDHKSKDHHKSGHHESGWDKFEHVAGDIAGGLHDAGEIAGLF
ncbi:unnamed protein product [Hermetia illucens]|uniref:Uncharacterized protein n=1 Tax=Hermetia illucens TaxID=343691 RepID=A0A7R8YTZ1_HERIL|nr:unnamed protein product [Hermetia illucens]